MEFSSIGTVGGVHILDRCDAVPRVLRLVDADNRDVFADFSPSEAMRFVQHLRASNLAALPVDARRVMIRLSSTREQLALAEFIRAWVSFETDLPPKRTMQ